MGQVVVLAALAPALLPVSQNWLPGYQVSLTCMNTTNTEGNRAILSTRISCFSGLYTANSSGDRVSLNVTLSKEHHLSTCDCVSTAEESFTETDEMLFNITYGPNVTEVNTKTSPFMLCPSETTQLAISCLIPPGYFNPNVYISILGFPGVPTTTTQYFTDGNELNHTYSFRPTNGGNFSTTCMAQNGDWEDFAVNDTRYIEVYEPPSQTPVLTITGAGVYDGEGATKTVISGQQVTVQCNVNGGYPDVNNVTIDCNGISNTVAGVSASLTIDVDSTFHLKTCNCTYNHSSACSTPHTGTFELKVIYGPDNIQTNALPFSLCPSETTTMDIDCVVAPYNFYPNVTFSLSGIANAPTATHDYDTFGTMSTHTFSFRPTTSGNVSAICMGQNGIRSELTANKRGFFEVYEPPSQAPVMTITGEGVYDGDGATKTVISGQQVTIQCNVNGGYPDVNNVTIDCNGISNTVAGVSASLTIDVDSTFHLKTCNCSFNHISGCPNLETSFFTLSVLYGPGEVLIGPNISNFSMCPSESVNLDMYCGFDTSEVNPSDAIVTFGEIPNTPAVASEVQDAGSVKNVHYIFRPTTSGSFMVECKAQNKVWTQFSSVATRPFEIFEPPPQSPKMTVNESVVIDGENKKVSLGDNIIVNCKIPGGYPSVTSVTLNCAGMSKTAMTNEVNVELNINRTIHARTCVCSYQHVSGCTTQPPPSTFTFDVQFEPSILSYTINSKTDETIIVKDGDSMSFGCSAEGGPPPQESIQKGQLSNGVEGEEDIQDNGHFGRSTTLTRQMRCQDSDTYTCIARNDVGSIRSQTYTVWVECQPQVTETSASLNGVILAAVFKVSVYPDPTDYLLYKVFPKYDEVEEIRQLVDPVDYSVSFTRQDSQFGVILLDIPETSSDDQVFFALIVFNGLDDEGLVISFNETKSELADISTETSSNATGNDFITFITATIVAGIAICFFVILMYMVLRKKPKGPLPTRQVSNPANNRGRRKPESFGNYQPRSSMDFRNQRRI